MPGRRPVLELLRSGRGARKILIAEGTSPRGPIGEIRRRAEEMAVPVRVVPRRELERQAPGLNHQGVVALTSRYRYTPLNRLLESNRAMLLFLDGVMDPHNLGSLLRSADGAGFHGIVIPAHRAAAVTASVRRAAAGAAEVVAVARVTNLGRALDEAKRAGLWILGLDSRAESDLWSSNLAEAPVGLVLGSEDRGLSPGVRRHCDELVRIPLNGRLESLNVAVAGAIAMFEVARRGDSSGTL